MLCKLESFLLSAKHFLYPNFSHSNVWELYYVIYFFQSLKPFLDGTCLLKAMENELVKHVKYAWKSMKKICSKSKIKAQEQHQTCSVVFIINFRGVSLEDLAKHLRWNFFCIQGTKANIFNWFLNTTLKLWVDFALINWLWFDWVTWRFSITSAQFLAHFCRGS